MRMKKIFLSLLALLTAFVLCLNTAVSDVYADDTSSAETTEETSETTEGTDEETAAEETSSADTEEEASEDTESTAESSAESSDSEETEETDTASDGETLAADDENDDGIPDDQETFMGISFLDDTETTEALSDLSDTINADNAEQLIQPAASFVEYTTSSSSTSAYVRGSSYTTYEGIDVSLWQGSDIDWEAVAASGVEYAIIKIGGRGTSSGSLYSDPYYERNITEAQAAGIKVGAYFFTAAVSVSEAEEEAEYAVDLLDGYTLDLPVYFDYEWSTGYRTDNDASSSTRTSIAEAFCDTMHADGYDTGVYASAYYLANSMDGEGLAEKYRMWVANYSSSGTVDGIDGNVDMDHFYESDEVPESEAVSISAVQSISDGTYILHADALLSSCVDLAGASSSNGANIQLYSVNLTDAQKYEFTYLDDGTYKITNVSSGLVLDVSGGSLSSGANVQQYTWNGTDAQKWIVISAGDGEYQIVNAGSLKALTVDNGTSNGTNIVQQFDTASSYQTFRLSEVPDSAAVSSGQYSIASVSNPNYVMAVEDSSTTSGANICLSSYAGIDGEQFTVTYGSDGTYTFTNVYSGDLITLYGSGTSNGTNIVQADADSSIAQKWYVVKDSSIAYRIYSALTGAAIDITGASISDGTNIQSYEPNGSSAQSWNFENTDIGDLSGSYNVESAVGTGYGLDVAGGSTSSGGNVQLYVLNGTDAQVFVFTKLGNGYYKIINKNSSLALDVTSGSTANYANVQQYAWNGSDAQLWKIRENSDGTYTIINRGSGKVLDLYGSTAANGTNIDQYADNGTSAEKWELIDASDYELAGIYVIHNAYKTQYVVDVAGASTSNGGNVQIYTYNGTAAQKFQFIPYSDGYYIIKNVNSGKVIDVNGGSSKNSANIQQYTLNYSYAQQWKIRDNGDGTYTFINRGSGKVFDIPGASFYNGANISQYTDNYTIAQKFYLVATS